MKILEQTYRNRTWQNETLGAAKRVAEGHHGDLASLGLRLGLFGYPDLASANGDTLPKSALQYIENHDHQRLVCHFGLVQRGDELLGEGGRERWYKVQPCLIGLLAARCAGTISTARWARPSSPWCASSSRRAGTGPSSAVATTTSTTIGAATSRKACCRSPAATAPNSAWRR